MPDGSPKVGVLFVCLGNICRSPLAEGVLREKVNKLGIADVFLIDSAGTGSWHIGEKPDSRMRATARRRGVSLEEQRARRIKADDLTAFDHIFAMDRSNLADIAGLDLDDQYGDKLRLFRADDPVRGEPDVPDPYFGGKRGFDEVFDIVDRTCDVLLDRLLREHGITTES